MRVQFHNVNWARNYVLLALIVVSLIAVSILGFASSASAYMRYYTNVDSSQFPADLQTNLSQHPWLKGFINVTKAPYNAGQGGDDTAALQQAIDDAYESNLVVFFPAGTYLVSDQLSLKQEADYNFHAPVGYGSTSKFGHILIGSTTGTSRPVIRLVDNASFQDKENSAIANPALIKFYYYDSVYNQSEDASRQYLGTIRGIDIDMGDNPDYSALYNNGAQLCAIEDVTITGTNFYAGIWRVPGSGGYVTNVKIIGGKIGILQDAFRPNPTLSGIWLEGQSEYGIKVTSTRGPLTVNGFKILSPANPSASYRAVYLQNYNVNFADLNMVDGTIEVHGTDGKAIYNFDQNVVLKNVYVKAATVIDSGVRNTPVETLAGSSTTWKKVSSYYFANGHNDGIAGLNPYINLNHQEYSHSSNADTAVYEPLQSETPTADFIAMHTYGSLPSWEDANIVDVVTDYGAVRDDSTYDNAPLIQQAIDDTANSAHANYGKTVYIPRGHFYIQSGITLKRGTKLIGGGKHISVIQAADSWNPSSDAIAVDTVDDNDANIVMSDFAIVINKANVQTGGRNQKNITALHVRGGNTIIRDLQTNRRDVPGSSFPQLLINESFESGTTGWTASGSNAIAAETTSDYVRLGTGSVKVYNRSQTEDGVQQDVTSVLLSQGQGTYTISGFMKNAALASNGFGLTLKLNYGGSEYLYPIPKKLVTYHGWVRHEETVDVQWTGTLDSAVLVTSGPDAVSDYYVDFLSMQKVELLENPSFEEGITGWTDYGANTIAATSSTSHDGSQSLLISNRNANYEGTMQNIKDLLDRNGAGYYNVQAWFKNSSGTSDISIKFALTYDGSTKYKTVTVSDVATDWTELYKQVDLSWTGTLDSAIMYTFNTNATVDYYADAFSLIKADFVLDAPFVEFSGSAGGKIFGLWIHFTSMEKHSYIFPEYRMLRITGTSNPLSFYQISTEHSKMSPQDEITGSSHVTIYGFKYEGGVVLLDISDSSDVQVFGGSGIYAAMDPEITGYIRLTRSTDVMLYNMTRASKNGEVAGTHWVEDDGYAISQDSPIVVYSNTAQLLANNGFEDGISGWMTTLTGNAIAEETGQVHGGSKSVKVYNRDANYDGIQQNILNALLSRGQGNYDISAWVKNSSGSSDISIKLKLTDGDGTHYYTVATPGVGTSWEQISGTRNVTWTGTLTAASLYTFNSDAFVDYYADDFSLQKQ